MSLQPAAHLKTCPPGEMDIHAARALIERDMDRVNDLIQRRLHSEVGLIDQLSHYIVSSGGKRLRPAVVLLSAGATGYTGNRHIDLAAIVEFIHTATLLHDDVVDSSELRRGRATANQRWGNEASVLVGDFLYSRAFQMMVDLNSMRVMEVLSDATNTIAEGEVQQLLNRHDPTTTEGRYLQVVHNKTAKLFEAAAQLGGIIGGCSSELERALADYGQHLGVAYQLIDDVLDYSATSDELGKNIGDDLAEGKPTLPLLFAMWNSETERSLTVRRAIENGGLECLDGILEAIESTGALAYTAQRARDESGAAISALGPVPVSMYKDALVAVARFAVERTH